PSTYPSYLSSLLFISIFYPLFVPLYPLLISLSCHGCYLCADLQVWRTDPGSIFDFDPVEDNIQSKSLQRLSGTALPLISVTLFIDISIYQSFYIYSIVWWMCMCVYVVCVCVVDVHVCICCVCL